MYLFNLFNLLYIYSVCYQFYMYSLVKVTINLLNSLINYVSIPLFNLLNINSVICCCAVLVWPGQVRFWSISIRAQTYRSPGNTGTCATGSAQLPNNYSA